MKDVLLSFSAKDSRELFCAIFETHQNERHPIRAGAAPEHTDLDLRLVSDSLADRRRRVRALVRRILDSQIDFSLEVRQLDGIETVSEYQLWTMSDWVAGGRLLDSSQVHFTNKMMEEYHEAHEELYEPNGEPVSEVCDNLFCVTAAASNLGVSIEHETWKVLNLALPDYAQRTSRQAIHFGSLQRIARMFPDIALDLYASDAVSRDWLSQVPVTYFDMSDGLNQTTPEKQTRVYATLMSMALSEYVQAISMVQDDELREIISNDREFDATVNRSMTTAFLVLTFLLADIANKNGQTVSGYIDSHVSKINERIARGLSPTSAVK